MNLAVTGSTPVPLAVLEEEPLRRESVTKGPRGRANVGLLPALCPRGALEACRLALTSLTSGLVS